MSKVAPIFSCFNFIAMPTQNIESNQPASKTQGLKLPIHSIFPKIHDKVILNALTELSDVKFDFNDICYMNSLGAKLSFASGQEAVNFLSQKNTKIIFDKIPIKGVFAQYNYLDNIVIINENYKRTKNKADILAISEAILHEAGHAKDNDYNNSVQEEINNLAIIVLAHKYYSKKYPNIFNSSKSLLVTDGVNAYADLFFDNDPEKKALINRLKKKYGYLPSHDVLHPLGPISKKLKEGNY